jgi:aldehyde dehydrogenase (NAD+)
VSHNAIRADYSIGFGGFKQSGVGREGGIPGLEAFVETKTILLDGLPSLFSADSDPQADGEVV